jgi:hypothetical protein
MKYPTYEAISDPASDLTVRQFTIIRPLLPGVQVEFRKAIRSGNCGETELRGILAKFAVEVFRRRSALEDLNGYPDIPSLRRALGLEADTALRYAHFVYKDVVHNRMLFTWHKQIADALGDEIDNIIDSIEDRWWEQQQTSMNTETDRTDARVGAYDAADISGATTATPTGPITMKERIEEFIERMSGELGRRITKKNIWQTAGYADDREFRRVQSGSTENRKAVEKIEHVLRMSPQQFSRALKAQENKAIPAFPRPR